MVVIFDFNACSVTASIVFHVLSSPRGAGTISLPFYRHRAARKQYLCHFIVTVRRGNNIFAILSSPCSAETISLPFYRRRSAREQYFCISVLAALLRALKFLFSSLQNGDVCWRMVGAVPACPPERPHSGVSIPKYICASRIMHEDLTMDAPLQGDTGGHTGPPLPISTKHCGVPLSIVHSIVHTNRTVSLTPSGLYFR